MLKVVATPIFYANADLHLGHLYSILLADYYARLYRHFGHQAIMTTGLDEHGIKVENAAKLANVDIKAYLNQRRLNLVKLLQDFKVEVGHLIYTDAKSHVSYVQKKWPIVKQKCTEGTYAGHYLTKEERYLDENETHPESVYVTEKGWYLPIASIESVNAFIKTKVDSGYVRAALADAAKQKPVFITRANAKWNINLLEDGYAYVWYDALNCYLSLPIHQHYCLHLVLGKDILRFHTVVLKSILDATEIPDSLISKITVHGHLQNKGKKISKSDKNANVTFDEIKSLGPDWVYPDLIRCYFYQFETQNDFTVDLDEIKELHDTFIVNELANCVHRVFTLATKLTSLDLNYDLQSVANSAAVARVASLDVTDSPKVAFNKMRTTFASINQYVTANQIWVKGPDQELHLATSLQMLKLAFTTYAPLIPNLAAKYLKFFTCHFSCTENWAIVPTYVPSCISRLKLN